MEELAFSFQVIIGFVVFSSLCILWQGKKHKVVANTKQAPEPAGGLPIIGHHHLLGGGKPLCRVLGAMADKLGPVFLLRLGVIRVLVVSTCEAAKECFTTNDQALASRPTYAAGKYLGYDFAMFGFSPYGPYWREVRKIATIELLSNRQLELLKHVRAAEVDMCMKDLYGAWASNGNRPVKVEMKQQFMDVTFRARFFSRIPGIHVWWLFGNSKNQNLGMILNSVISEFLVSFVPEFLPENFIHLRWNHNVRPEDMRNFILLK